MSILTDLYITALSDKFEHAIYHKILKTSRVHTTRTKLETRLIIY